MSYFTRWRLAKATGNPWRDEGAKFTSKDKDEDSQPHHYTGKGTTVFEGNINDGGRAVHAGGVTVIRNAADRLSSAAVSADAALKSARMRGHSDTRVAQLVRAAVSAHSKAMAAHSDAAQKYGNDDEMHKYHVRKAKGHQKSLARLDRLVGEKRADL